MTDLRISGASANSRSECDVRLNLGDPTKVIAASNNIGGATQAQFYSTDGGASWNQTTLPGVAGDNFQADPQVDWTSDGRAWALTLGVDGSTNIRAYSYQSTDNGATWSFEATISGTQTGADRELLWIDHSPTSPFRDQVYAIWHNGTPVFFARRTAGAAGGWGAPIQLSGTETTGIGIGGDVKTNSFGDVFVLWPDADGSRNISVVKSTDGGVTFTPPLVIAQTFANTRRLSIPAALQRRARVYISADAYRTASKDLVYAVWSDLSGAAGCTTGAGPGSNAASTCKTRVWFTRSTNGGATWSPPVMLNNQASLNDQFHSRLCVDQSNGNLIVSYRDTVNDSNRLQCDVFMQTSTDDGQTWSTPVVITSARTDESDGGADANQYGDYDGLHGHYGKFFPVWMDRRNSANPEEVWAAGVSIVTQRCFFILDRSSFGQDEVLAMLQLSSPSPATVSPAFYVVVEGFSASDLGITAADLTGTPSVLPSLTTSAVSGMTVGTPTLIAQDPSLPATPQRFTWVYSLSFSDDSGFTAELVNATLMASLSTVSAAAVIELRQQPNPYAVDGQTSWLSTDLRVFQLKANQSKFGATLSGSTPTAASNFIKAAIANLNSNNTAGQSFDNDIDANATQVALFQNDSSGTAVFNFAIAKVRYRALVQDATTVRVFFRLFPALTVSLAYDPATTYRRWSDGLPNGQAIPLLGTQSTNILSIPCFADLRVNSSATSMTAQTDAANVQSIVHDGSGAEVDQYFGCWLDMNQPSQSWFPLNPTNDGPFGGTLQSVLALVRNAHQCLVAEIAFDPAPIPGAAAPSTSDKLAQRNLSMVLSDNPGDVESRRIPNTFEVHPTPLKFAEGQRPDELMIDWGNLPAGSVARIYFPDFSADEIVELAAKRYFAARLARLDDHTIECAVGGISYIPLPAGADINVPGLLTIDLPLGVRKGQRFNVVVRQITHTGRVQPTHNKMALVRSVDAIAASKPSLEWREVLGTFQISIPVLKRQALVDNEMRLLSVLRWILLRIPAQDRWYLVFRRYVDEIAQRVRGLGGDPVTVLPSPNGVWGPPATRPEPGASEPGAAEEDEFRFAGKITGLIYDRFGDFEGFVLDTERGERTFHSREHEVEDLAKRAWRQRIFVYVFATKTAPDRPLTIVLRRAPRPFQG